MNEIVKSFFSCGHDEKVQECVLLFLETVLLSLTTIEQEHLNIAYVLDDINETIYHNEEIRKMCRTIKQQYLFKLLADPVMNTSNNEEVVPNDIKKSTNPFPHLKFFDMYQEKDFVQPRFKYLDSPKAP